MHRLLNPRLTVRGLLPTMYDGRSVHSRAVLADVRQRFDLPVLPPIPRSVRFAEAPGAGGSILSTARNSTGAKAYREVAGQLVRSWRIRATKSAGVKKKAVAAKRSSDSVQVAAESGVSSVVSGAAAGAAAGGAKKPDAGVAKKPVSKKLAAKKAVAKKAVATKVGAKEIVAKESR